MKPLRPNADRKPRGLLRLILDDHLIGGAVLPWQPAPSGVLLGLAFAWLGVWMLRTQTAAGAAVWAQGVLDNHAN